MVLARFLPRNEHFFEYFHKASANASMVAQALVDLLDNYSDVERKVRLVRDLEHQGDEITHQIFDALHRTFVTPIDREDIAELTGRLDDFVDAIEEVTRRIWLYRIEEPTEYARLLARIIGDQAGHIVSALGLLENLRQRDKLRENTVSIKRLESEADEVLDQALAGQFDGVDEMSGLVKAMRWGEIYNFLESATDRAEDVAHTIERIVVKNV